MSMMYVVTAINIYNSEEITWEFNQLSHAMAKVRELKDTPNRYIVTYSPTQTIEV